MFSMVGQLNWMSSLVKSESHYRNTEAFLPMFDCWKDVFNKVFFSFQTNLGFFIDLFASATKHIDTLATPNFTTGCFYKTFSQIGTEPRK